ncbi:MAG: hypothetical protein MI919_31550 [Holophagales bacterium]|nr:hypothetical protein [Holophagales bacterium]
MGENEKNWATSASDFVHSWRVEHPAEVRITQNGATGQLSVTTEGLRGFHDDTYLAGYDSRGPSVQVVFPIAAHGIVNGEKQVLYTSAAAGASPVLSTSGPKAEPGPTSWGLTAEDFDGTFHLPGGGQLQVQGGRWVETVGVPGLTDGVYQAIFDLTDQELRIVFAFRDDGYVDGLPNRPKLLLFSYPELQLSNMEEIPTEGERFEEIE